MSGCAALSVIPLPASNQQVGINPITHSPMNIFKRLYITWLTQKIAFKVWRSMSFHNTGDMKEYVDPISMIDATVDRVLHMYRYNKKLRARFDKEENLID